MSEYEPLTYVLNKKELQRYENDSNWQNARRIIFMLFWISLMTMITAAIIIILKAENYMCRMKKDGL